MIALVTQPTSGISKESNQIQEWCVLGTSKRHRVAKDQNTERNSDWASDETMLTAVAPKTGHNNHLYGQPTYMHAGQTKSRCARDKLGLRMSPEEDKQDKNNKPHRRQR